MARKKKAVLPIAERFISFLGSVSSIAGLVIALPAAIIAFEAGKKVQKKEDEGKAKQS